MFRSSINNTWKWVCAFDSDRLVGIGRILSDGALYALVCDMIVLPEYQNQGIGSSIIKMIKDKCIENDIQRVWLFAAPGRSEFYLKHGFQNRPEDAPGMQMANC
jgi:GNAT superfamily N-acetyltransferase